MSIAFTPRIICSINPASNMQHSLDDESGSSSSHRQLGISETRQPLQVARDASVNWAKTSGSREEGARPEMPTTPYTRALSLKSERIVASRIAELSLLDSPLLRVLAKRLGSLDRVEKRKYDKQIQRHPYASYEVGQRWQEIQGSNRWDGLLDPIDPVLRAEIVRYGEFAQATYDTFDGDKDSKYCGSCRYSKAKLLEKAGLDNRGYEITEYIYATDELNLPNFFKKSKANDTWSKDSNWMGFVAVCVSPAEIARLGRRDIVVAWRGTVTQFEWIEDVLDLLAPAGFDPRNGSADVMVESGFLSVYKSKNERSRYNKSSAREQALKAVQDLVEKYKHEGNLSISVTGHSLGSALATLCGYDIAESQMNLQTRSVPTVSTDWEFPGKSNWEASKDESSKPRAVNQDGNGSGEASLPPDPGNKFRADRIPITVFSFGGPRVGNRAFRKRMEELGVAVLRVVNVHDMVTKVPGAIFGDARAALQRVVKCVPSYKHVGVKLLVDNLLSEYLQKTTNPVHAHSLEAYLHLVDSFQGTGLPYKPTTRDIALVNKWSDFLKHEYYVPPCWWQEENKGMARDEEGHWVLPAREPEVFPPVPLTAEVEERNSKAFWRSVSIAAQRPQET